MQVYIANSAQTYSGMANVAIISILVMSHSIAVLSDETEYATHWWSVMLCNSHSEPGGCFDQAMSRPRTQRQWPQDVAFYVDMREYTRKYK